ncbi:hypothetical protein NDU88_005630 [Pleurodeles waltl]|uniref:Uncharacterized protein n=1 Tax=Pleurodeles waltl TaxID=8319 RepID=A0AAV7NR56_PLEWA|nr:hypothetical protein NDU88_005630 [Pleurodeles waltl]
MRCVLHADVITVIQAMSLPEKCRFFINYILPIAPQRSKVNAWGARCARLRLSFQTRAGTASDSESEQLTLLSRTSRLAVTLDLARPLSNKYILLPNLLSDGWARFN